MSFVHICPKCKKIYKYPSKEAYDCPECNICLYSTGKSDSEWFFLSQAEKNSMQEKAFLRVKDKTNSSEGNILITTGYNFEGYTIESYMGCVSGNAVQQTDAGDVVSGKGISDALDYAREIAIENLQVSANKLGSNAIIGISFDYLHYEPTTSKGVYYTVVTAIGTAVKISKKE